MRLVLGIDAAWTETGSSGVALAEETARGWRLIAVEASYSHFCEPGQTRSPQTPLRGEPPDVPALLDACRRRAAGRKPDLVAIDMPLSQEKIVGPRCSDRAISRAFGARKAATYTPNAVRPGPLSDKLRADFAAEGYRLCTAQGLITPGVIEVYPHAALLELTGDGERLKYKAGKTKTYWPELTRIEPRREKLREVWKRIVALLDEQIDGVAKALLPPAEAKGREEKSYEDRLDAVVCAYVAITALRGEVRAYGDDNSAIFVPENVP